MPEYRFAVSWVGNLLSKASLLAFEGGKETKNQHALDAMASLFGGPDGQPEMLRLLGTNFTVAGEAWIIGEEGSENEDNWRVVAGIEVKRNGLGLRIAEEEVPDNALAIRLWKPHPRKYREPDSPSRAVIPILNELVKLTEHVDATANSRLASAGILFVPSEVELPAIAVSQGNPGEEDHTEALTGADGLSHMISEAASAAISDRSSAAALVPIVVTVPGEHLEKVNLLRLSTEFDEHVKGLREEAIRRIATGMDMPPEVVTGTEGINHWGQWQIEEAAIKSHTEPLLSVILSSLTVGYLRPYLESQGVENVDDFTVEADTKEMRLRPNRSKEAMELYDRGELSAAALLRETGFDDVDAISEEELRLWLTKQVAKGQTMPEQVVAALRELGVDLPWTADGEGSDMHEARPTRSLLEHPVRAEPDEEKSESQEAIAERESRTPAPEHSLAILTAAADQMVYRALERAGNRVKGKFNGTKMSVPAAKIYQIAEVAPTEAEAQGLLEDAWTCVDRFSHPGVDNKSLKSVLNQYTTQVLMTQCDHSPELLSRFLKGLIDND